MIFLTASPMEIETKLDNQDVHSGTGFSSVGPTTGISSVILFTTHDALSFLPNSLQFTDIKGRNKSIREKKKEVIPK